MKLNVERIKTDNRHVFLCTGGDISKETRDAIMLDMPHSSSFIVPVDTETTGLNPHRDELCLVQFSVPWQGGDQDRRYYMVEILPEKIPTTLMNLLQLGTFRLVFHNAMFDLPFLFKNGFSQYPSNRSVIRCTRLMSKIVRTYSGSHSLKDVVQQYCDVKLDKTQQTSSWRNVHALSQDQLKYAVDDIFYLPQIHKSMYEEASHARKMDLIDDAHASLMPNARLKYAGYDPAELKLWGY